MEVLQKMFTSVCITWLCFVFLFFSCSQGFVFYWYDAHGSVFLKDKGLKMFSNRHSGTSFPLLAHVKLNFVNSGQTLIACSG